MGIFVGIANAFSVGLLDVFIKKLSGLSPNFLTWVRMAAAAPVLAVLITLFNKWSIPPWPFWVLIGLVSVPLEITLAYLGTKAIQISPLSLIAPIGAFSSVFLIPVGYIVLGELPSIIGGVGVLLIVVGSFFLGWRRGEVGLRFGLRSVFREPGAWLALLGAFLASIAITIAKFSFRYALPLLSAFYTVLFMAILLLPVMVLSMRQSGLGLRLKHLFGLSVMSGAGIALHYTGLSLIAAVYYISVKRLSTVVNIFFGRIFFGEDHTVERLAGAIFMVAGVILIALG